MKINISEEMAQAVVAALRYANNEIGPDVEFGRGEYTVSYEEALSFFTELNEAPPVNAFGQMRDTTNK